METYTLLRHFADSWAMLVLLLFFVGMVLFLFRPGARALQDDASNIPFRHEAAPSQAAETTLAETEARQ